MSGTTDPSGVGNPPPLVGYVEDPPGSGRWTLPSSVSTSGTTTATSGAAPSGESTGTIAPYAPPVAKPVANFTYTVYAGGFVAFVNTSVGLISNYAWSFGDGTSAKTASVLHRFIGSGTFPVTLTVANTSGSSSKTINVAISATPIAETVDFTFAVGALGVQFTDISTKAGTRNWDFGDGETSTETSPYHTYATNGFYTATLTISGVTQSYQVIVDRGVRLDWQDNSSDETGFKIEHCLDGASWVQIATTAAGVNTLLVTMNLHGVNPTVLNYFRVCATNAGGDSAYTNIVTSQCG